MYMPETLESYIHAFAGWLEQQAFAVAIADSAWLFPAVEIVHVFALSIVVGSISMIDLRLLGLYGGHRSLSEMTARILPWTWCAFLVAASAGFALFSSKATMYVDNPAFQIKMIALALAGMNMLTFQLVTSRTMSDWDNGPAPVPARIAGGISLMLWITVVAAGRWIGFLAT